jgi:hypothetical protein
VSLAAIAGMRLSQQRDYQPHLPLRFVRSIERHAFRSRIRFSAFVLWWPKTTKKLFSNFPPIDLCGLSVYNDCVCNRICDDDNAKACEFTAGNAHGKILVKK